MDSSNRKEQKILAEINTGSAFEKGGNFEKALMHYKRARALSQNGTHLQMVSRFRIARTEISLGRVKFGLNVLKVLRKSVTVNKTLSIEILNALAYGYRLRGENIKARTCINTALRKLDSNIFESDAKVLRASVLHNRGGLEREESKFKNALKTYSRVLHLINGTGDDFFLARIFNNIGFIHRKIGDYELASSFYEKAYKIENRIGARNLQARTLNNLGGVARMREQCQVAYGFFNRSVKIRRSIKDRVGLASSLLNKGIILKKLGQTARAKQCLYESLKIRKKYSSKSSVKEVLNELETYGTRI